MLTKKNNIDMKKLAIIGSGIAGMGCAYFLDKQFDITVFEKNSYIGGHTNTVSVEEDFKTLSIDTGFMVFNKVTYPNLIQFFSDLDVSYQKTDMSFSVHDEKTLTEWNGAGLHKIFSQKRNIFKPSFWSFLGEMKKFCEEAEDVLKDPSFDSITIGEYIQTKNFSPEFKNWFLIPMGSAIWSTSTSRMVDFPLKTLLRFFLNHGFLGLDTHYQWFTVTGGSKQYVNKLKKTLNATFKPIHPVGKIEKEGNGVTIHCNNQIYHFDAVILACHANEALNLLNKPTQAEQNILGAFNYERNTAYLHSDQSVMPDRKSCWAAWNYRLDKNEQHKQKATVHYWMNRLQKLNSIEQYFVSLNVESHIDPSKIHRIIEYEHPVFDLKAIEAQSQIDALNNQTNDQNIYFCGSYFKYGFHEDAFTSALNLSRQLGGFIPWEN